MEDTVLACIALGDQSFVKIQNQGRFTLKSLMLQLLQAEVNASIPSLLPAGGCSAPYLFSSDIGCLLFEFPC